MCSHELENADGYCCCCSKQCPLIFWRTFFIVTSLLVTTTFCFTLTFMLSFFPYFCNATDSTWMLFVCETTMYHVFKRIIGVDLLLDITQRVTKKGLFFRYTLSYLAQYDLLLKFYCFCVFSVTLDGLTHTSGTPYQSQEFIVSNILLV